jgi:glutamine---fructose-6-phosphate transaminase (isomerizing)
MCGIVGAIAQRNVADILLEGIRRLEYRGYDSAGLAIIAPNSRKIQCQRAMGKVSVLEAALAKQPLKGSTGIAHTRWATHGEPSESNAHPHCSRDEIAIVHNGIIENHHILREKLITGGYTFSSETDTEVISHLLHHHLEKSHDPIDAIQKTAHALKGAYALGIIISSHPDQLFAVRHGSPLVIGLGIGEHFIASDPMALLPVTQRFIYLEDGDIAQLTLDEVHIQDKQGTKVTREIHQSKADTGTTSKGKYRHFMLKEIFEQPEALSSTIEGHHTEQGVLTQAFGHQAEAIFKTIQRVHIIACGTSYHAGLVARHWLEDLAGIPCQVEVSSENRYRNAVVEDNTLFIALSQSGETADTLAAIRQLKQHKNIATLAISNAPESALVRESDLVFITRAGTEIGVAATKTFTTQLVSLLLLTSALGQYHHLSKATAIAITEAIQQLPGFTKDILTLDSSIQQLSKRFSDKNHALFLGRGEHHPIALEGALKLKEISYVHAEAYPAGELKHGPLALVDENMPVIVIAPNNHLSEKLASNVQEVQARGGEIFIIGDKDLNWPAKEKLHYIEMPKVPAILTPIAYSIPLQLLSYHIAVLKGTDVDQPRNLAKSVTVE